MDQTTSIQPPKNIRAHWKKKWGFYVLPTLVIIMATWYGGYLKLFALSNPYAPGATLDPACAPGDPNCTVQVIPDQTGNGGKILSTDGSTTLWKTETGGAFDGNQVIRRSGLPGVNTAAGAGGTTLQDFIQNYFFPSVAPGATSISISGGTSREIGGSTTVSLSWTATKNTNPITTITLGVNSSGTVCGGSANATMSVTAGTCATAITGNTQSASGMPATTTTSVSRTNGGTTTFSLTVSDGSQSGGPTTTTLTYNPKVYIYITNYDYLANPSNKTAATISSDFINGTPSICASATTATAPCSIIAANSNRTITATLAGQYLYYAVPTAYGISGYNTGSFRQNSSTGTPDGSVGRTTVTGFTNASSFQQDYYIYGFHADSNSVMNSPITGTLIIYSP